jgi:hypothetical protein
MMPGGYPGGWQRRKDLVPGPASRSFKPVRGIPLHDDLPHGKRNSPSSAKIRTEFGPMVGGRIQSMMHMYRGQ